MSLSWRDRLHVVVSPARVVLLRLGKGAGNRVVARETAACPAPEPGAPAWQPALATLQQLLPQPPWQGAEARMIVSSHLVHYLLVPWQEKVADEEEQEALVRYSFTEVYGDAAADWDIMWDEGRPPAPALACAADRRLLEGLRETCRAAGLPLVSIRPYLMAAFNRWRRELDGRRDWFLLAEPGRLCLAWFRDEEWDGLDCQQVGEAWGGELPRILERALLLSGRDAPPQRLCIHAPEIPAGDLALAEGWSGNLLQLPSTPGLAPAEERAYAMAMTA